MRKRRWRGRRGWTRTWARRIGMGEEESPSRERSVEEDGDAEEGTYEQDGADGGMMGMDKGRGSEAGWRKWGRVG